MHRRFMPANPARRPCASRIEFTQLNPLLPRGTRLKNTLLHRRSSNYCRQAKISPEKSEVAPNKKIGLFTDGGQLLITFRRNYAPRAKTRTMPLEKRVFELDNRRRDSGLIPKSVWLTPSDYRPKTYAKQRKARIQPNKIRTTQVSLNIWDFVSGFAYQACRLSKSVVGAPPAENVGE